MSTSFIGPLPDASTVPGPSGTDVNGKEIVGTIFAIGNENPFYFYDVEIPASLTAGHEKLMAVHQFIGGKRTIDTFGVQPDPLEWSGILMSLDLIPAKGARKDAIPAQLAINRAEALRELSDAETEVTLNFHTYSWVGVIRSFKPTIRNVNEVDYTIRFEIISEDLKPQTQFLTFSKPTIQTPQANLLADAIKFAHKLSLLLNLVTALKSLADALVHDIIFNPLSVIYRGAQLLPGSQAAGELLTSTKNFLIATDTFQTTSFQLALDLDTAKPYETLGNEAYTRYLMPETTSTKGALAQMLEFLLNHAQVVDGFPPYYLAQAASMGQDMKNDLARMQHSYNHVVTPTLAPSVIVVNPNLHKLALQHYGTVEAWRVIADANGLTTPAPIGTFKLTIPLASTVSQSVSSLAAISGTG